MCHPANTGKTIADVNITFSAKVTNHHFYYRIFVYRNNFKRLFICCCANFILREITTLSFHKSVYVPGYRPLPANPACYTLIERVAAMFLSVWRPSHATEQSRDCTVPLAARTRLCQRSHIHLQSRRRWDGVAARPAGRRTRRGDYVRNFKHKQSLAPSYSAAHKVWLISAAAACSVSCFSPNHRARLFAASVLREQKITKPAC